MTSPSRLTMNAKHCARVKAIEERVKAFLNIAIKGMVQCDYDSYMFDLKTVLEDYNQFLGLNVKEDELIPRLKCIEVINTFKLIGIDYDEVPVEGLTLPNLIQVINVESYVRPPNDKLRVDCHHQVIGELGVSNANGRTYFGPIEGGLKEVTTEMGHPGKIMVGGVEYLNGGEIKGVGLNLGKIGEDWSYFAKQYVEEILDINKPYELPSEIELDSRKPGKVIDDDVSHMYLHVIESFPKPPVDIFPDIVYPGYLEKKYSEIPFLSPSQSLSAGIEVKYNGDVLHPRHWRYGFGDEVIILLNPQLDPDLIETEISQLSKMKATRFLPKAIRIGRIGATGVPAIKMYRSEAMIAADLGAGEIGIKLLSSKDDVELSKIGYGCRKVVIVGAMSHSQSIWKKELNKLAMLQVLEANYETFGGSSPPNEPTVKGNSRQAIIDNGKHSWPAAKKTKSHRKHH